MILMLSNFSNFKLSGIYREKSKSILLQKNVLTEIDEAELIQEYRERLEKFESYGWLKVDYAPEITMELIKEGSSSGASAKPARTLEKDYGFISEKDAEVIDKSIEKILTDGKE